MVPAAFAGERNAENCTSPRPFVRSSDGVIAGCEMTGMMVRVMTFQSALTLIGTTGWILRMFCVPFCGPTLKLVLFWNGTLIMFAIGFCASFASSSALIAANAGEAAAVAMSRMMLRWVRRLIC
jgi:hypothetical protein